MEPLPFVSVIVPARDEALRIGELLGRLCAQTYPAERMEIVVVDDGSTDATSAVVREIADERVRLLREPVSIGPDAARNRALIVARGAVLAFTDADCKPAGDWLALGVQALRRNGGGLVAGRVVFELGAAPRLAEVYDSLTFLRHEVSVARRGVAFTANLFVAREVATAVGGFRTGVAFDGDAQFTAAAVARGFVLTYAPEAVVRHPARRFRELCAKAFRIGKGKGLAWQPHARRADGAWRDLTRRPLIQNLDPRHLARTARRDGRRLGLGELGALCGLGWLVLIGAALPGGAYGLARRILAR